MNLKPGGAAAPSESGCNLNRRRPLKRKPLRSAATPRATMGSWLSSGSARADATSWSTSGKAVLVTGCDRGIGFEIARRLDSMGFKVLAAVLFINGDGAKELKRQSSANLTTIKLDVTCPEDVERAKTVVKDDLERSGNLMLWGVVNNAGICNYGNPEIMKWSDMSAIVDVNLKGPMLVTKAFLPQLRRAGGRLVNITSIAGTVPLPSFSIYNATKAGLLMYSKTLRYDLERLGVKVCAIMPGGYSTKLLAHDRKILGKQWWDAADEETKADFGRNYFEEPLAKNEKIRMVDDDLGPLVDTVIHALTSQDPKPVYNVGPASLLLPTIYTYAPQSVQDWFTRNYISFKRAK